jgi:MFS family permease
VGSGLTSFALGVWVFGRSGSATQFALIGLFATLPRVLLSPLAGALVDRWDRRRVMILSDAGAGLSTLIIAILLLTGRLEVWQIYLCTMVSAAFGAIQWPAYMAATSQLITKEQLGRANGLVQLGQACAEILAPTAAGVLLPVIRMEGVILIDLVTLLLALLTLLVTRLPRLQVPGEDLALTGSLREEMATGWRYIQGRPGLRGLLSFFVIFGFIWGMVGALIAPMILGFTSSQDLGAILSIAGAGMLIGSLVMSVWGGPRRRIRGVLQFEALSGLFFVLMGLRPSLWTVAAGAFGAHLTIAVVSGSNQAIWQSKVAPEVQGRVFATQQMLVRAASPLAYLLAGPLADRVFNPLLIAGGQLAPTWGVLIGTGAGRGIGLMFLLMGTVKLLITLAGWANPRIRLIEDDLPDVGGAWAAHQVRR